MLENDSLCQRNDLLSSDEVSQDWHPSMHDHMSTPFNVFLLTDRKTAVQAFHFIFTKQILLPTKSLQVDFHVRRQSSLNEGSKSATSLRL